MITPKVWGFEDEVWNQGYCQKRMYLKEQWRSSIHMHTVKDEVLFVAQGVVWFESGLDPEKLNGVFLQENQKIHLVPGIWHRFTGIRTSYIFESSTHHEDSDVSRMTGSGKVSDDEFRGLLQRFFVFQNSNRILTMEQGRIISDQCHGDGRLVGMVNGCFDIFHVGHMELLRQAKLSCEVLFVGVNNDLSVRLLKGDKRPINPASAREGVVASSRYVDYVVECENTVCVDMVDAIRPQVYVTTVEYGDTGPEARQVVHKGGRVIVVDLVPGYSTTGIARRLSAHK